MGKSTRRRKRGATVAAAVADVSAPAATSTSLPGSEPGMVASSGVTVRGVALCFVIICGPYCCYILYLWFFLQFGVLRSAVADSGLRQVLIVGTQSSGTSQTAASLRALGLEVQHEASDTSWSFARDGTVSSLHGMRFFAGHPSSAAKHALCDHFTKNIGFHPAMFRDRGCSYREEWGECWRRECIAIVDGEWGCALRASASASGASRCETPYARQLLQTRHPLRTLESLAAKFCLDSTGSLLRVDSAFAAFAGALFPPPSAPPPPSTSTGCIAATGAYLARYMEDMLAAHAAGALDATYRVEDTEPCAIARHAGFLDEDTAVYRGAHIAARTACTASAREAARVTSARPKRNRRNKGRVNISFDDVRDVDAALEARLRTLARAFGYESYDVPSG